MRLLIALLLLSCGTDHKPRPQGPPARLAELVEKLDNYQLWIADRQDENGFVATDRCDSLLFSGLLGTAIPVNLEAARDDSGKWFRRPAMDCYATGASASEISKDMYIGVSYWAFQNKRADVLQGVLEYGRAHNYVMGEGPLSRTYMTPGLQGVFALALRTLMPSMEFKPELFYPQYYPPGLDGFESHLQILNVMLFGDMIKKITDMAKERSAEHYMRNPRNPLFAYLYHAYETGDANEATNLLLDDPVFPNDHLPTSSERCEEWIFQRDPGHNWEPCPERAEEYSGADFVFLAKRIATQFQQ